jgi:hypothetical protein
MVMTTNSSPRGAHARQRTAAAVTRPIVSAPDANSDADRRGSRAQGGTHDRMIEPDEATDDDAQLAEVEAPNHA